MSFFRALCSMVVAPRRASWLVLSKGATAVAPVLLYFLVRIIYLGKGVYWAAVLAGDQPGVAAERFWRILSKDMRNDALVFGIAIAVVIAFARWRKSTQHYISATLYLLVPLSLLSLFGCITYFGGFDIWWLPHHPVDGRVVIVSGRLSVFRLITKAIVTYGPLAVLFAMLLFRIYAAKREERALALWPIGAVILGVALVAAAVGSILDVQKKEKWLRPSLAGDVLLPTKLPWLKNARGEGPRFSTEAYKGKVLLIDFWASWCAPCRRAIPELSTLQDKYKKRGLVIVGINREARAQNKAAAAWQQMAPSFPSAVDDRFYGDRLGLRSLPTSFLVDEDGIVRHMHLGYVAADVIAREVEALLAQQADPQ